MTQDEIEIRQLVKTWMEATKAGDTATVLSLMTDDVLFLVAGRPPMSKADFAAVSQSTAGQPAPKFDGESEILELRVIGDWAYMVTRLRVTVTPPSGPQITRAGHTLTILQKEQGKWRLARDANLLTTTPSP